MPGGIKVTIRDGRPGRAGTGDGPGEILEERDSAEPFTVGDKLTLEDGTEVVAIGVDNHIRPKSPWMQTVHVGDVF